MSESTTEAAPEASETPAQEQPKPDEQPEADQTDWKAEARKWEQRAKDNSKAASELEKQRKAAMTDAEKAVVEAEERGRTSAASEFGKRLATSEIRAAAATAGVALDGVFDYLDLSRFVDESGEPDQKAIKSLVAGLSKEAEARKTTGAHVPREGATPASGETATERRFARNLFASE